MSSVDRVEQSLEFARSADEEEYVETSLFPAGSAHTVAVRDT
ncbi:hypothetical protein [Streptomyces jumonjinensis]|nr:hypothetical protein [Streptomyces jumonjinensis]